MHAAKRHLPELGAAAGQDAQQPLPGTCTVPSGQRGCCLCPLRGDKPADRTALRAEVAEKAWAGRAPGCAPGAVPAAVCCCAERGRTLGRAREKSRDGDEQEGEQHETGCGSPAPRGRGQPCLLPAGRERIKLKTGGQALGSTGPGAARTAEEAAIPAGSSAASRAASPDAQRQKGRRFGQPDALLQGKAEQRCSHQTQPPDIKSLLATDTQQSEHHKQPQTSITQQLPSPVQRLHGHW